MTLEEGIRTSLEFERRVRDTYGAAAEQVRHPEARRFFRVMAREEQGHVDYLQHQLATWTATGRLAGDVVASVLPNETWLREGRAALEADTRSEEEPAILEHLYAALRLEEEVSRHYRELVSAVDHPDAGALFQRFLEIEDGHTALVQAEIDYHGGTGLFYGVQEFTLDG